LGIDFGCKNTVFLNAARKIGVFFWIFFACFAFEGVTNSISIINC